MKLKFVCFFKKNGKVSSKLTKSYLRPENNDTIILTKRGHVSKPYDSTY